MKGCTHTSTVVITGASSGIGEVTARLLATKGHQLVLAARRADRLAALEAELSSQTPVLVVPTDVADPAALEALALRTADRFGRIDVWINNAGMGQPQPWWEATPAEIETIVNTNLTAPILGTRAALAWMIPQKSGHIINVASVAGHVATTGIYSATKFGLRGHTEALYRELRPLGIQVSLVSPGFVRTEMTQTLSFPMPTADVVARVILNLIDRPRREVVVPGFYRPLITLARLFPGLADGIVKRIRRPRTPR